MEQEYILALGFGGYTTTNVANTGWNGTSWTEVNDLNSKKRRWQWRYAHICFVLGDPSHAQTESWNGTSWSEVNDLA